MDIDEPISRQSLADKVAERLRREILSGALAPGQRLIVPAMSRRLGVSHIPIREALRWLEAEALVESVPSRGVVVAGVDIEELHDLWDLRRLLEADLVTRAFPKYDDQHLAHIRDRLAQLLILEPDTARDDWWIAHRAFHLAFLAPATTPWTERVLRLVWQSAERYQRLFTLVFGSVERANADHRAMVKAAGDGDGERLRGLTLAHLAYTEGAITKGYSASQRSPHDASAAP